MIIREYQPSDCKELAELFYNTVHTVNARDYTKEQLEVWATGMVDLEGWNQSLQENYSIIILDNKLIIGFGDIDKNGYLNRLYVHKDYQGKGVATAICDRLEKKLAKKLLLMLQLQRDVFLKKEVIKLLKSNMLSEKELCLQILLWSLI